MRVTAVGFKYSLKHQRRPDENFTLSFPHFRNDTCDWQSVFNDLSQVIGCLFYTHFLFVRFCIPVFQKFGQESFNGVREFLCLYGYLFALGSYF